MFSLARLARFMAEQAEELGVMVLPETDAQRCSSTDGAVRGIRTGDKGRGRQGEELARRSSRAPSCTAQATVLADGVQGMLSAATIEHFGLQRENPQVYALGVKEVWRVPRPLDRVIHTHRLAAQGAGATTASSAARSSTRWAPTRSASGSSSASTMRTPRSRCTTCCRSSKTPSARPPDARGRRAHRLGRQGDPRGRLLVAARERLASGRRDPAATPPASSTCRG